MEELDHIGVLVPDPHNRRKHTARNIGLIVDALHKVGAARSIVIDEDNIVRAGNGTLEAAAEAGITKLLVVDADGETLVAVRRTGLTDAQKRDLGLYDNRATELSLWDAEVLQQDVHSGVDLSTFFSPKELEKVLKVTPAEISTTPTTLAKVTVCPSCGHTFTPT
jgi:ParB-like chromosome segregation protein Spo0J